ncbi:acetolactate synthase catalytic subunit [Klebsiella pneumoniae]|uniref:Acetolactate synthase catalytic subunit n=1 Tax=Klebsiella pneumoniae TaxID=573 RepID=A0A2X1QSU5_KLEPN|nr:acetolactate synthase catalytic subunit [Klebsiella pneumoniae]
MKLPVLVVVGNNGGWGAVAGGTKALYPDGYAARAETIPATAFTTSPDFAAIAASSRAAALSVSRPKISPACWKKRYPSYAPADRACWLTCS